MTLKGKTNLLFCHIVSLSSSFFSFVLLCGIMGICESVVMCLLPLTLIADMLPGFKEGQEKMSKSDLTSAIFMEDDEVFHIFGFPLNHFWLLLKLVTLTPNIAM
jgi:hypothetical protein